MTKPTPDEQEIIDRVRATIEAAIYEWVTLVATTDEDAMRGAPMLTSWACSYEYTSAELEDVDQSADGVIVASDSQSRSSSRGVLLIGADRFRR